MKRISNNSNKLPDIYKYIIFKGEFPDQFEVHKFGGGKIPSPIIIDSTRGYAFTEQDVRHFLEQKTYWKALSSTPFVGCWNGKIKIAARMDLCTPPGGSRFIKNAALIELLDILEDPDAAAYEFVACGWFSIDAIGRVDI